VRASSRCCSWPHGLFSRRRAARRRAIRTPHFYQSLCVLYQRCIDPAAPPGAVPPADAAALLLRAVSMAPHPKFAASLPPGAHRQAEAAMEQSDVLACLCSYVAVEAASMRRAGRALADAAAEHAHGVLEGNADRLEELAERRRSLQQHLAEARDAEADARAAAGEADARAAAAAADAEAAAMALHGALGPPGGDPTLLLRRREADQAVQRAEAEADDVRAAAEAARERVSDLMAELTALRRQQGPLKWQYQRMARLEEAMQVGLGGVCIVGTGMGSCIYCNWNQWA
jgi:hypothetical protein